MRKVRLTGGEPLVRRGILDICRGVAAIPGVEELCLTTNGVRLPALADGLRSAGVDRLNVSLDTLRPDRYAYITRVGRLEDVFAGLRAAEAAGFTGTKLNVVLMKGFNDDEIGDFVRLTEDRDIEVRFIELMPIGQGGAAEYLPCGAVLEACPDLEPVDLGGVARRYRRPGARGLVGLIQPMSCRFCDPVRPHPGDGGRHAQALPPLRRGDPPPGPPRPGPGAGHPGGDRRQAGAPPHGGDRPQRGGAGYEQDRRIEPWS